MRTRFVKALELSFDLHKDQMRKGDHSCPYFAHLMSVSALVLEHGGNEDAAIAALLHDAKEDQGGDVVLALIRSRFGDDVASIVDFCSDTGEETKPPWQERKDHHLAQVKALNRETLTELECSGILVLCADKLHNARDILTDVLDRGPKAYEKFRGGESGTLWYLRSMADAILVLLGKESRIALALDRTVTELIGHSATLRK